MHNVHHPPGCQRPGLGQLSELIVKWGSMTQLGSFGKQITAAIIGASGGIGQAFCRQLTADSRVAVVHAFSRSSPGMQDDKLMNHRIDIEDESSIAAAAAEVDSIEFDLVLVLTGILHEESTLQPERRLSELTADNLRKSFAVNTIGPAMVAKHFLPKLKRKTKTVFAALSARVGSITDNRLGGWASYRASKAALNQVLRTISSEQARLNKASIVVALHPGTVDTGLSKPFTGRTPPEKLFSPEQSAGYLLAVIDNLGAEDTGGFFAWDGQKIEY